MVKNLPEVQQTQETWIGSLGREDPLGEEMAAHSSIAWENPVDRGAWWATVPRVVKSNRTESIHTSTSFIYIALLLSGSQQSEPVIHIHISTLF